jgi:rhodanese-related sulfurtransferase
MDKIIQFIINHWLLFVGLIAVIGLIIFEEKKGSIRGIAQISAQQAINLINHDNAVVIDVRDADSFQKGHLLDAININIANIETNIKKLTKYKSKPLILVCDIGQASAKTGAILKKQGFDKVYSLAGGITAWQKDGLPLVKK